MAKRIKGPGLAVWLQISAACVIAAPAYAQETESGGAVGLEDIVVTATRSAANMQDVPVSVTAVTGQVLSDANITQAGQLTYVAPSLQLTGNSSGRGATQFAIRGIGTASFSHMLESSVSTVIDGVPLGRPDLGFTDFADLERVEVLGGPQGMLFGKNATAGVINIVSRRPQIGETEGSVRVSYASVEGSPVSPSNTIAQGMVNVPVSDDAALRLNMSYTGHGSLFRQINPNPQSDLSKRQISMKGKFLWEPSDALSVYVIADYARGEGLGAGLATSRGYYWGTVIGDPTIITPGPNNVTTSADGRADLELEVGGVNGQISYTFDSGYTVSNITAYRKYTAQVFNDNDGFSTNFDVFGAGFNFWQFSSELRLESPKDQFLSFQAGLYYFRGQYDRDDDLAAGLGGLPAVLPGFVQNRGSVDSYNNVGQRSYAVYGEAVLNATDRLRFIAGGRLTHDKTDLNLLWDTRGVALSPVGQNLFRVVRKDEETDFSYRAGAQYDLADDIMIYGTYSRGYKGGGYNFGSPNPAANGAYVKPEIAKVWEAGFKSTLLDRRLRFNATLFYGDYQGFQAQGYDTIVQAFTFNNAGVLRTKGAEVQLDAQITEDFMTTAGVAYVDAYYKEFTNAPCYGGQTAALGCVGGITDVSGNRLTNAPEWTVNFAANYKKNLNEKLKATLRGEFSYRSAVNFAATHQAGTYQKGYSLFNAYAGIMEIDDRWGLTVFCKNCFDQRFVNYISPQQGLTSSYRQNFSLDSFRQIGVTVDFKF